MFEVRIQFLFPQPDVDELTLHDEWNVFYYDLKRIPIKWRGSRLGYILTRSLTFSGGSSIHHSFSLSLRHCRYSVLNNSLISPGASWKKYGSATWSWRSNREDENNEEQLHSFVSDGVDCAMKSFNNAQRVLFQIVQDI